MRIHKGDQVIVRSGKDKGKKAEVVRAIPKSDKLPYTEVSFLAAPDFTIRRLEVKGQDNSLLQFTFENEKQNPPVPDTLFRFTPPPGAEYVDSSNP